MPFTSRETPMKNQMEIPPSRIFVSVPSLPQKNVYYHRGDRVGTYHTANYAYDTVGNLQTGQKQNGMVHNYTHHQRNRLAKTGVNVPRTATPGVMAMDA